MEEMGDQVYWLVRHDPFRESRCRLSSPSETEAEAVRDARQLMMADRQVGAPTTYTVVRGSRSAYPWAGESDPLLPETCSCQACCQARRREAEASEA